MDRPHRRGRAATIVSVGLGGAMGTVARHKAVAAFAPGPRGFPWTVFALNVAGSFVLGLLATLVVERWPPTRFVRPFAGIGFCGGLTTFSTWMVDADLLARDGAAATATLDIVSSLAAGLIAVYLGIVVARMGRPRRHEAEA